MIFPVPILIKENIQKIALYTASEHVHAMEISTILSGGVKHICKKFDLSFVNTTVGRVAFLVVNSYSICVFGFHVTCLCCLGFKSLLGWAFN